MTIDFTEIRQRAEGLEQIALTEGADSLLLDAKLGELMFFLQEAREQIDALWAARRAAFFVKRPPSSLESLA